MSASAPDDFRSARKRVRIAAGKVSASVALSVTADSEWESDEEVLLRIEDVSDPAVSTLAHEQGTVTIRDDDVPPPPGLIYSGVFGNPVVLTGPTAPGSVSISWDEPIGGGPAAGYDLRALTRQRDVGAHSPPHRHDSSSTSAGCTSSPASTESPRTTPEATVPRHSSAQW